MIKIIIINNKLIVDYEDKFYKFTDINKMFDFVIDIINNNTITINNCTIINNLPKLEPSRYFISIKKIDDNNYSVKVGCLVIKFSTLEKAIEELKNYIKNPIDSEKQYTNN